MQEDTAEGTVKVWGFHIPMKSDGRRSWPDEIRAMAIERIAAGAKISDIVAETGAHKSLVAKWVRTAKPSALPSDAMPAFIELVPSSRTSAASESNASTVSRAGGSLGAATCRIRIGGADVEIPAGC